MVKMVKAMINYYKFFMQILFLSYLPVCLGGDSYLAKLSLRFLIGNRCVSPGKKRCFHLLFLCFTNLFVYMFFI